MIYVFGIFGFFGGFLVGQMTLYFLLRHRSTEDLLNDKSLRWKYGIINWVFAGIGAYIFISMYRFYFSQ